MEMKQIAKHKTLWKMSSTSEPLSIAGTEANPLKKFTIPKIRRTAGKVYLSTCCTNTREYSFIHDTLNQCRLDINCDLQSSWQFGDTKLVHNEDLEKNFTVKRSEMRESGRHGRELEEHFCFLALPQQDVVNIYQNGISTNTSTLKILGNPLLGIYTFRHVDVALNYAHSRNITVESIIIFKVLFGRVKKIQPSVDKNKVSLDPSPNFDCHMSRNTPSLKDSIELQAYSSAVYFYEYNILSKPVDKPRQCLPYAIVTVKFIGQKIDNGYLMTSLRSLSTGFLKRAERTCSLNNCTVAKRIGKGKDATVIFEHFRKPIEPFVQENCSCNALNSEINPSNSSSSNSFGNGQNGNISILETHNGQTEHLAESSNTSQVYAQDSGLLFMSDDTRESVNGDLLLNLTYLKNILSGIASPLYSNIGSSTVTTSKLIKDPRLMRREESMGKQNNKTGVNEILAFEKSLDSVNSEVNLSSVSTNSVSSSEIIPDDHVILPNCLDAHCFKIPFDDSQSQVHNMCYGDYDYIMPNKITMARQCKGQGNITFPISLSKILSEVDNQNYSDEKVHRSQQRINTPLLIKQNSKPHNFYEPVNTCTKDYRSHISQETQSSGFQTVCQTDHQMSTVSPFQKKESIDDCIQNIGNMRNLNIDPEDNSKHREEQNFWKEIDHCFTNETKASLIDNCISLHQEHNKGESLDSSGKKHDQILLSQELELSVSSISTTKDKYELDSLAKEVQSNLTPTVGSFLQNHPQHSLEYKNNNIHTSFVISQKQMELTGEKTNQNCVSIMTDAFQEAKDISQVEEQLIDTVISSHGIETAHNNFNCNIAKENICVPRKNENELVLLEDNHKDFKDTPHIEDKSQDHPFFFDTQLNNDILLNIDFKEQNDNENDNQHETKEEDISSSVEDSLENIHGNEQQVFHTIKNFTDTDERRENKNCSNVELLISENFSTTFNMSWEENYLSTETTLIESEDIVTALKQNDPQNSGRSLQHLASTVLPEVPGSTVCASSNPEVQITRTSFPALSTNHEDHQKYLFKETCFSESPDFDLLVKHRISDCGVDMDINTSPDSFYQSVINENLVIQNLELENEIEVVTEECDDAFVFQQDTYSHGNVLREELEASYEALKARINWEALFGSSNWETEALESTKRKVNTDQHSSEEHNYFYSSTQNTKAELLNPVLLPDLQITITNDFSPGFSPTPDSHVFKDNFYKCLTEAEETEINKGEKVLGLGIYPQSSGENSYYPCGDKSDNITQESGLVSKSATSLSFDVSHNTHINHMSGKENNKSLFTGSSNVTTVNNESSCAFAKLHTDYNDTRSKKHMESRVSKRKLHSSFSDQNISHKDKRRHEMYEKKRRLTGQDSYECFLSLSQGRFKIFSKSEKHIKSVLDILNSEASLCKSKRLSRKLDKAVLHLKKAHRRVHTSLQLIAKVGEKKKGPLPKSYAIICNNFWESCDLEGYSSVYEGKYYSTKHFFSKRRDNKESERRALEYDGKSLTHVSKHKSYKRNGERTTETLSKRNIASSVSRSHTTIHMKEFCDQEQHPETQLCLASTSQSTSQSAYNKGSMNLPESSELQPLSGKTRCLFSPDHPNEKLPEKENQIDKNVLSNIGKYEKFETRSTHSNTKDVAKEIHSMANEVINKSNSVSLSCMKESVNVNTNKKYDASHIAHTEVKADILISVLEPSAKYILNVDTYKPDNILSDCKRNLEINFSIEKCPTPVEHSQPNIFTRNFSVDPLNLTLMTSKKYKQFSAAPVTDSEGHAWKSYLDKQRIFAVDSFATFTLISHQQECGGRELLKREQCSSSNCSPIDGNDTNVTENSNLNLASVTEEKSYGKTTSKKLFSNDSYLLLADNVKVSFLQQCVAKKKVQDRKTWKVKRAEKAKDSIGDICHQKSRTEESSSKTGYKNRKKILEEESSYLSGKTMKHNLIESHVSTANATYSKALPVNNTVPNPLNKKKKERKVNSYSQSDSIVHCEITCNFKPGIIGIDHPPISHVHPENSKITTFQKKPMLYMNGLKEKHDSAHHTALITKLSQILQRADEASSLHILQEESKICQNILPSFVEAFERNQECSLEQILISRELLVQQNLWDNCKNKLKPCAVDSLVELQMMMETIQFVENKKRLLRDEPTFRSLLWYDETLYSELLGGPRGYQQQSNFYPAFQGRLKYNAFCELQKYHDQLTELLEETKRGKNSYYAFLKYKRQIKECEAIMKHCSDCFDFFLSVPFTCGVNFGDNLGDLETIRKSTLELISVYGNSAKVHSYPGKQDHMWIIIEIISSKVNFIKSNEARSIKISLYGLEHIFFDAAKNLVWEERKQSLNKKYTRKKYKEMLLKINQDAFSKLQEIYDTLSEGLSREQISGIGLEKETMIACRKSDNLINKTTIRFNSTLLSHPDICCISEILDQAKLADFKELQELSLRCTNHLEILKKYFQMLQEDNIDNIFITEENALDMVKNQNRGAVILKPEAIETYIEIVMILETMHFLRNSMAKKLDRQRFRGMLWFDSSLLPELVHCQEKMACFSFLKDESTDCLWKVIETAISELKKDMDIIYKYKEAVNCSYALHLLSRELEELSEIKTLLKKSECSISVYIDFVPYIASVNYGSTVTELEYNYNQFSTLLQNTRAAPRKDLGKMAHIMRVMKTIEHMKIICTKNAKLTISFILRQMLYNRKKTLQLKTEGKMNIQVIKHEKSINESSTCMKVPSIPECISNSSVKRPIIIDLRENAQEQEKNITPSVSKKQKVDMKDVTKINKEKAAFRNSRTTRPHPHNENKVGPSSSHNLKRNHLSPKKTEILRSPPGSLSPLRDLKDTCTSHSKSKVDLTDVSSDISEDFTRQQRNFNSVKKNVNFSAAGKTSDKKDCAFFAVCDQNSVNSTFSKDNETPSQKFLNISPDLTQKSCPSNIEPETNASFLSNTSVLSKPAFHSMRDTHTDLELNDPVLELQDNEILNSPIKNSTNSTSSSEPMFIQNKIPAPQVNETQPEKIESEENYMKDTLNPGTIPNGASGSIILNVNQTAEYSLSEQQSSENSKALTQNAAMCWNELPQSAYAPIYSSSEHSFGTSYPYYAWFVYHYSSINVNSITETYQGITSYEAQPLPSGMLTTVASTIHNTHSDLFHSQYFGYFAEEPQANDFVPVNGYFQSQMPISYNFQQPIYPQSASHQTLPQAADLYPPNPDMLPEAPWTYAPWQQESFHPGH